jgi:hypothetical protein
MPAMTSLSLTPSVVTCLSTPCDFRTRSQRFRRDESPDMRHDSNPSMPTQSCVAARILANHTEITGPRAADRNHGYARPVIVMVET